MWIGIAFKFRLPRVGTTIALSQVVLLEFNLGDQLMSLGPVPLVAVGTLSGNLPIGAGARTLGAPPVAADQSFNPVGLDESKAVTGVTLNSFPAPKIGANNPDTALMQQQLLAIQEQNQS